MGKAEGGHADTPGWKPDGYPSVSPYLLVTDARGAISYMESALAADLLRAVEHDDGSIRHAEMRIADSVVMLGQVPDADAAVAAHLHLYVPDAQEAWERAVEHGGESVQEPVRQEGESDRRGGVRGPCGTTWWFGTVEGAHS